MKICWDNLEKIRYSNKTKKWYTINSNDTYIYKENCKNCKESFLTTNRYSSKYCSNSCSSNKTNNNMYGKHHSEKTKRKISESNTGRRYKRKNIRYDYKSPNWKSGVTKNNIPLYDTYAHQIEWCEEVRRNKKDKNILEVKCTYCGKWYIPTRNDISKRIQSLKEQFGIYTECRLYCSNGCKQECSIYRQQKYPKFFKISTSREVQPELRQMVFKRDNYVCQKCGSTKSLHCHHLEGILWEPLESADLDKCVTLCKSCHKEAHRLPDCGYNDLQCSN